MRGEVFPPSLDAALIWSTADEFVASCSRRARLWLDRFCLRTPCPLDAWAKAPSMNERLTAEPLRRLTTTSANKERHENQISLLPSDDNKIINNKSKESIQNVKLRLMQNKQSNKKSVEPIEFSKRHIHREKQPRLLWDSWAHWSTWTSHSTRQWDQGIQVASERTWLAKRNFGPALLLLLLLLYQNLLQEKGKQSVKLCWSTTRLKLKNLRSFISHRHSTDITYCIW